MRGTVFGTKTLENFHTASALFCAMIATRRYQTTYFTKDNIWSDKTDSNIQRITNAKYMR